jgi:UDP-N-acetylmuramate dehydrogenase
MELLPNVLLAPYTTFHIGGPAKFFLPAQTDAEVIDGVRYAQDHNLPLLILGGGSNILISDKGFEGLVLRVETIGMDLVEDTESFVRLKVASGEIWDHVVRFAVEQNWYGIENLSHIPGFAGGLAFQNVGAYGQEASEVIESVEVLDVTNGEVKTFSNAECGFTYRHSIFNTTHKDRYVILHTVLKLAKKSTLNLSYGDVRRYFAERNISEPTITQVREAIIEIRNTKYPFPEKAQNGHAGSFFRGPILTDEKFTALVEALRKNFGDSSAEKLTAMHDRLKVPQGYKTPAAFLVELSGMKGYQVGGAKVHETQPAIVLNATGQASANEVLQLFIEVARVVYKKTGVILHIEPSLVGFSPQELAEILESAITA